MKLLPAIILRLLLVAASLELTTRLIGFKPFPPTTHSTASHHRIDDVLGWSTAPGSYSIPWKKYDPRSKKVYDYGRKTVTYLADGSRATSSSIIGNAQKTIYFFGDSIVHGYALADDQTFLWKVQDAFSDTIIFNYGLGAYGTLQSYLLAKRILAEPKVPFHVILHWAKYYKMRDAVTYGWITSLPVLFEGRNLYIPRAYLDNNENLQIINEYQYLGLPLRSRSSFIRLIEELALIKQTKQRKMNLDQIQFDLILRFQKLIAEKGGMFSIVTLATDISSSYSNFFKNNKIDRVNCYDKRLEEAEYRLKNDLHPNEKGAELIASCLNNYLSISTLVR